MAQRLFGVVGGAGVQVREIQPAAPIEQGPFGSTILVGVFRSGPTAANPGPTGLRIASPLGVGEYRRIYGGLTQDSEAPLNAEHFYELSRGAGQLHVLRVTDGSEVAASLPIYNRDVERAYSRRFPAAKVAAQVATYRAANGGRWGGRRTALAFLLPDLAVNVASDSTVALAQPAGTYLVDQFKGGILKIPGVDAVGEYKVLSNTDTGLFTVEGVFSDAILGSVATDEPMTVVLENEHELTGDLEALAVEISDSGEDVLTKFSIRAHRDGVSVNQWLDGGLAAGSSAYWLDKVQGDLANYEMRGVDLFSGDPNDPLQRPANFAEVAQVDGISPSSPNVIDLQTWRWQYTGAGTPYVESVTFAGTERPSTIVCTFNAATTADVVVTFDDGTSYEAGELTLGTLFAHGTGLFPEILLRAGAVAAVAGAVLTLRHRPLPPDLASRGALLYIAAAPSEGDVRTAYRVVANDHDSVTVSPSVDLSAAIDVPTHPSRTGTVAGPFVLVAGETTVFDLGDGEGNRTLTSTLGAGSFSAQQLATHFNTLANTEAAPAARLVEFSATSDNKLKITATHDAGASASFTLRGAGTLNAIVGFPTPGDTVVNNGTDGQIVRLQWRQELGGGYDGIAGITDSDYEVALDTDPTAAPLSPLLPRNTGVLKVAVPGVQSAAVQTAAMAWAYAHNGIAIVEIPDTVVTEAAAIAYHEANLAVGAAADYHRAPWPSYGKITNPYGSGLYTTSMLGAILGLEARQAVDNRGFHLAPAGVTASLSPLFKDLTTGDRVLNNEALNGYGLTEVRKTGAAINLFGDRIPGSVGRPFYHKRVTNSHIGRVLLTNTLGLVFKPINAFTFAEARRLIRGLFTPWFLAGWFSDDQGPGFDDQVSIKVDDTNNPLSERTAGNLHIDISYLVVDTAERVIFTIGPRGVSEET